MFVPTPRGRTHGTPLASKVRVVYARYQWDEAITIDDIQNPLGIRSNSSSIFLFRQDTMLNSTSRIDSGLDQNLLNNCFDGEASDRQRLVVTEALTFAIASNTTDNLGINCCATNATAPFRSIEAI